MLLLYLPHLAQNEYRSLTKLDVGIFMKTFFCAEFIVDFFFFFTVPLSYLLFQLKKNPSEKEREEARQFLCTHVDVPALHPFGPVCL